MVSNTSDVIFKLVENKLELMKNRVFFSLKKETGKIPDKNRKLQGSACAVHAVLDHLQSKRFGVENAL